MRTGPAQHTNAVPRQYSPVLCWTLQPQNVARQIGFAWIDRIECRFVNRKGFREAFGVAREDQARRHQPAVPTAARCGSRGGPTGLLHALRKPHGTRRQSKTDRPTVDRTALH